jgi:gliding motility-associated-like protein
MFLYMSNAYKMTRVFYLVTLLLLISIHTSGQCPTVTLNSFSGSVCDLTAVTVTGTFTGATMVIISENGRGSVNPAIASVSPFTFTYTPARSDLGQNIEITVTAFHPLRRNCPSARVRYTLTVNPVPPAPDIASITQPTCFIPTGSVLLRGLPASGTWSLKRNPDGTIISGRGTTQTISELTSGRYHFLVRNSAGCVSAASSDVIIATQPPVPRVIITDPDPACFPATVDLTSPAITSGSSAGVTYTYWRNSAATQSYNSPSGASEGIYYIKGTLTESGCYEIKPVAVTIRHRPVANAGSDKVLDYLFETRLEAFDPGIDEDGRWSVLSGSGVFSDVSDARATVRNLKLGQNIFLWTLWDGVCQPSTDTLSVFVKDMVIPNLITPDMDGKNDYFVITQNEMIGKIELVIFNRSGFEVYKSLNYDNSWNGMDYNGNPLPEGTYFYIIRTEKGRSLSGFIMIRRNLNTD